MKKNVLHVAALSLSLATTLTSSPSAYSQDFEAWQGKAVVREGDGGTKRVVDGIDLWDRGVPPQKFIVIGYIHDKRHSSGLFGVIRMAALNHDIARVAKQAGGDAVISVSSEDEVLGTLASGYATTNASATVVGNSASGQANTSSFGFSRAIREQESEYAVLKYVPDQPAAGSAAPTPNEVRPSSPPPTPKPGP